MNDWSTQHRLIEELFASGLAAVEPRAAVRRVLELHGDTLEVSGRSVEVRGRIVVIAVGKAAGAMSFGAIDVLGDRISRGIALTKDGHFESKLPTFECFEARHPLPDSRGIAATQRILDAVSGLGKDDIVVTLISGGGSALLEAPVDGVLLEDFQRTTDLLLKAGAPIQHLNAVRSVISQVKGGGLRRHIGEATCVSLILSDVLGNDPSVIASGPTVAGIHDREAARALVLHYNLLEKIPPAVRTILEDDIIVGGLDANDSDIWEIIADNRMLIDAISASAHERGEPATVVWRDEEGEARELAVRFVELAVDQKSENTILIGGGEATVTVRGTGAGGRNTEFALAAAIELDAVGNREWCIASLGSDGQDGSADAAGAIADPDTVRRARTLGLSAIDHLQDNDSAAFFRATGGLVETGPTGTNVNDLYIAVKLQ